MNEQSRNRVTKLRQAAESYLEGAINERHLAGAIIETMGAMDAAVAATEPGAEQAATDWYQRGASAEAAPDARQVALALAELQARSGYTNDGAGEPHAAANRPPRARREVRSRRTP